MILWTISGVETITINKEEWEQTLGSIIPPTEETSLLCIPHLKKNLPQNLQFLMETLQKLWENRKFLQVYE